MATIQWEEGEQRVRGGITLADRIALLEKKSTLIDRTKETEHETKSWKYPWKWKRKFAQTKRKRNSERMLVIFLNKKNEIEPPKFMPIFEGNMIIWKNKPYEFDPRAVWTVKGVKGNPRGYLIKEIDRRPVRNKYGDIIYKDAAVSNMDLEEIRARGDSTESDEFLIKAALKAQVSQGKKAMQPIVIILILLALGVGIYFLTKGG